MRRVTRPGGIVASGVFDFWGGFSASALVYDTGSVLDGGIRTLRDDVRAHPLVRSNGQAEVWRRKGLSDVVAADPLRFPGASRGPWFMPHDRGI
jgi:hypothetical protein